MDDENPSEAFFYDADGYSTDQEIFVLYGNLTDFTVLRMYRILSPHSHKI
jgi:hypothetical protein